MNNINLYHFGIHGQKWGFRRFQNSDGSLTAEGKIRYGKESKSSGKRKLTKQSVDKKKAEIMRSDSASKVYKHTNLFTTDELNKLYQRLDTKDKISQLAANEAKQNTAKKGKTFIQKVDTAIKVTKKMSEAYAVISKVADNPATYGEQKKKKKKGDN